MAGLLNSIITKQELKRHKAMADFSYCVITKDGIEPPTLPRFFLLAGHGSKHPGVKFYQNMVEQGKRVVVIAGPHKVPALKAALRGKLYNVLITDQYSAEELAKAS